MRCKTRFFSFFALFILGIAVFSFSRSHRNDSANCFQLQSSSPDKLVNYSTNPNTNFNFLQMNRPNSELMARLFQLMFILFFISPPIIALMLFLIWKELKKRNELK